MDCPACGSPLALEVGPERPLSTSLPDALWAADADERIEITRDCWDCGWHEVRQIHVESIDTTAGDEAAVERAALVDEVRQLYERYQAAESDAESEEDDLNQEDGKRDRRRTRGDRGEVKSELADIRTEIQTAE